MAAVVPMEAPQEASEGSQEEQQQRMDLMALVQSEAQVAAVALQAVVSQPAPLCMVVVEEGAWMVALQTAWAVRPSTRLALQEVQVHVLQASPPLCPPS